MDSNQRSSINTSVPNVADLIKSNNITSKDPHRFSSNNNETSTPTNTNTPASPPGGPAKSSSSVNNTTGISWMKAIFGGQQPKQPSSSNGSTSPRTSINASYHHPEYDLSYITPRLIVMSTPRENSSDVSSRQTAESIRDFLDTKHPESYTLFSLDQYSLDQPPYRKELFHNRVVDLPLFDDKQSPRLVDLLWFCQKLTSYLLESPTNIIVLHCDRRNQLVFGACSLLACHQIFARVDQIVQYYESRRCANSILTMSQKRYIQYLCDLSSGVIERPHFNELIIKTIHLSPIPFINRQKNALRPFIDIYDQENKKIFSTYQEPNKLRVYSATDNICVIPINIPFNGDITIHISHAITGAPRQNQEGVSRICELTINSNFSALNQSELSYSRNELDIFDRNEKSPSPFRVIVEIINSNKCLTKDEDSLSKQLDNTFKRPQLLFRDENDFRQTIKDYEKRFKQQNDDVNGKSEVPVSPSPVVRRQSKPKDEPSSPSTSNSSSPRNSDRFSFNIPTSFINPRHNQSKQNTETSPRSSVIPTSPQPTIVEKQKEEKLPIKTLLDIGLERSISSDAQRSEFDSSLGSNGDLLDDDFYSSGSENHVFRRNISQISLPPPIQATSIIKPETIPTNPPKPSPNYAVDIQNSAPTPIPQPNPIKPKVTLPCPQKSGFNSTGLFADLDPLKKVPSEARPQGPVTLDAQRKVELAKDLDPTVFKVREWTEGKERNIRTLLCSLTNITWPECGWKGCQMHDLLTPDQVRKVYLKAVLHIHPDKLRDTPNEPLAKLIFVELNEAWSQFEKTK